jgi:glycosyltransferase involved in cell wall biosynthesis
MWGIVKRNRSKIVVVGTISNVANNLSSEFHRLLKAFADFEVCKVILVESDSSDETLEIVNQLQKKFRFLNVISLGTLKNEIPDRINRIRYCRQRYVSELRVFAREVNYDYVIVADLDGMNRRLTRRAVRSCFKRDGWDVVTANQLFGYYDLLALRHQTWCPKDVLDELKILQSRVKIEELNTQGLINKIKVQLLYDAIRKRAIYSKMRIISPNSPWISTLSSFGGLGVYKAWVFNESDYQIEHELESLECEHVILNTKIRRAGGEIFINPRLINNFLNTYSINRFFIVRQVREMLWNSALYSYIKNR